jgi:sialic acid synthase SpsE/CMP-N-acetylneuraminic acid synthetase
MQPVGGRPLIAWTIAAARASQHITRVVVSTDDDEIAAYACSTGAEVPTMRPRELASDTTLSIDALIHMVDWLDAHENYRPELVVVLQPTSPLRTADDIDAAVTLLQNRGVDSVISVAPEMHPESWTSRLSDDGVLLDFGPDVEEDSARQNASGRYAQNGAVYVIRRDVLVAERTLYGKPTLAYVMPAERSLDVDERWQLTAADALLRRRETNVIHVGDRTIGGSRCFVIAELGVNHNGRVEVVEQLIDAAAAAGADAVKLQTWDTDELVTPDAPLADYQHQPGGASTQYELLKKLELPAAALGPLKARAEARHLEFFSTPDDHGSADVLERLGVRLFKIGSAELTNIPLLQHIAAKRKPVILSTGMATLDEVEAAVRAIESAGNRSIALLHCVSAYPSLTEDSNLRAMHTLAGFGHPVGFSDHTLGTTTAMAAVALGAAVIEKHLTLDKSLPGPDHRASLDPAEFREMVAAIRVVEGALGDGAKRPTAAELRMRAHVRRVIVAARPLRAGQVITEDDVVLRRANHGMAAAALATLVGRTVRCDITALTPITPDLLVEHATGRA